jgi:hypothetical protein
VTARSLQALQLALRRTLPGALGIDGQGQTLELSLGRDEPPRLESSVLMEDAQLQAHAVQGAPRVAFSAFLDGVQESRVVAYAGSVPVVASRVAAVVRVRNERRLTTWPDGVRAGVSLYAPHALLPRDFWDAIAPSGLDVVDTSDAAPGEAEHPHELLRRALRRVKDDREALERELSDAWAEQCSALLYVDGGLPRGAASAVSPWCVGVIKSHHTLYVAPESLGAVLALPFEHRSSVFRVSRNRRPDVASWYLRLRQPAGRDPMFGLVRVEIAITHELDSPSGIRERANEVSRWILAERSPLSLPDARWDRMVYGIRDCEQFLRSIA